MPVYSALGRLRQENYKVQITSPHTEFQAANSTLKEKKDFFSRGWEMLRWGLTP